MNKKLLLIIIIGLIVRLINSNYPPLLWDEAALGYNGYSILKTGKDEYNNLFPYILKSFGDYKPALYAYLTIPFISILGLNSTSVRLPSIIAGSLIPFFVYLLITKLSRKSINIALITAAIIALNPWNIHFSRGSWETNILLFELVLATYLFVTQKFFWSATIFGLTLFTYQGGKIMSPLLILILIYSLKTQLFSKEFILKFGLPLFLFSLPILSGILFSQDSNRLQVIGLWTYQRPTEETNQIIQESNISNYQIFHQQYFFIFKNFIVRYFNHFSPRFLVFEGDWQIGRHSAPYIGTLLFPTFIFFIYGLFQSLAQKSSPSNKFFLGWLIVGPLPDALTLDIIQPVRTLSLTIPLTYFAAYGINKILTDYSPKLFFIILISYILCFGYYLDLYYHHLVKVKPDHWLYGYHEAINYTLQNQSGREVTFTDFYGQPYIYYLFYAKYDPQIYQNKSKLISHSLDTGKVDHIDNISFQSPNFSYLSQKQNQLIILSYDEVLRQGIDFKLLTPLNNINGHASFYGYKTNN